MVMAMPKHYWLYTANLANEQNLDHLYQQGWRAVQMTALPNGDEVVILLEKTVPKEN